MLAIASFSGCDRQEPTCSKCENQTDTVYVSVPDQQEDSIMNLLCHKWKIVEFVDDWNGTRTVPEGINDNFMKETYTITFTKDLLCSGYTFVNTFGARYVINTQTSAIHIYDGFKTDVGTINNDGLFYEKIYFRLTTLM